jgi:hypothetical protein
MQEVNQPNELDKIRFENDVAFNRDTTLLSSGALVLSVGFIEKLIPISTATSIYFLYFSWCFFILSLLLNLFTFLFGSDFGNNLSIIEPTLTTEIYNSKIIKHNKIINCFNYIIFGLLITGIISILIFVFINFNQKNIMEEKKTQKPEIQFLNEGFKYSLKKEKPTVVINIEKPKNTTAVLTQTADTITIKVEDNTKK